MTAPASPLSTHSAWKGWLAAILAVVCFSIAPPIARTLYDLGLTPTYMLFLRFWLTLLLLTGTVWLTGQGRGHLDRRGAGLSLAAGLATGVSMLCYFWSITLLPASIASMIFSIYPLVVLGLLALRGEQFTLRQAVRLVMALTGLYLLLGPGGVVNWLGVALVLISIMTASLQSVFVQWYLKGYSGIMVTLWMVGGIQIIVAGYWLAEGAQFPALGWQAWLGVLVLAVVSTYLSRLLWFAAVRLIGGGQVSMLVPLETLLTVIWSVLFLSESLSAWQWAGGVLILLSALLVIERWRGRRAFSPQQNASREGV